MKVLLALLIALPLVAAPAKLPPPDDLNTPPADAVKEADGLITKVLAPGTGTVKPTKDSIVRVRYTVWKSDGTFVQHIDETQTPIQLGISKMVPGWGEAVQMMVVGETRRAWVPQPLNGGKTDLGMLFDTELVEIVEPPTTPPDVAAPPADATVTDSGLAYKVLRPGTGTVHPKRHGDVEVHYSGWTTDGKMFDSSVLRGQPVSFSLDHVIRGWTEGLQLMVVGEKTRFWIPAKMAYGNDKKMPQGMLVFDIELLSIQ